MKKLFLVAITILIAFAFTACKNEEKTKEELLCQKKGWLLFSATSNPAFTNIAGVSNQNLFVSFFEACELDDILYFYDNKSSVLNFGKLICDWDEGKDISLGNWRLLKNDEVLEFHLPYFFNDDDTFYTLEAKIIALDENTMTLGMDINYDNGVDPTKGKIKNDRGIKGFRSVVDYYFTFTYKVAK